MFLSNEINAILGSSLNGTYSGTRFKLQRHISVGLVCPVSHHMVHAYTYAVTPVAKLEFALDPSMKKNVHYLKYQWFLSIYSLCAFHTPYFLLWFSCTCSSHHNVVSPLRFPYSVIHPVFLTSSTRSVNAGQKTSVAHLDSLVELKIYIFQEIITLGKTPS